jgi:hypothetical protein
MCFDGRDVRVYDLAGVETNADEGAYAVIHASKYTPSVMLDPLIRQPVKLRAIAREAVIFALIGLLLAEMGGAIFVLRRARQEGRSEAMITLHAVPAPPKGYHVDNSVEVPLKNGTVLFVAACTQVHAKDDLFDQVARQMKEGINKLKHQQTLDFSKGFKYPPGTISDDCVVFRDDVTNKEWTLTAVPLGEENQVAIEKQYWRSYLDARNRALENQLPPVFIVGLFGFPAGLVVWLFYRLVRFAVKG